MLCKIAHRGPQIGRSLVGCRVPQTSGWAPDLGKTLDRTTLFPLKIYLLRFTTPFFITIRR